MYCNRVLEHRLGVSLVWSSFALGCLIMALRQANRLLGHSSLLIFAASALEVLLYDLDAATPLIRIACLVVVGITLYIGGLLYKRINALEAVPPT